MRQALLLPNELFDDGSFECFNFWLADDEGMRQVDAALISTLGVRGLVEERMADGHRYLDLSKASLVYAGLRVLEIQWG